ncbi:hypothetical protein [Mucilaginibacter aquariorum]|uniref:PH domain-containing protein n=1 Tax=Mucilaginibacter aquariorum TaxID=2967225 RepID=A0ABT1T9C5_9SPHI|nr:hypothetical protein [Mucilaginibacter aquariorum]MCQ6960995.1 hypothetical protein [Mucilaginibacter aquariorum]
MKDKTAIYSDEICIYISICANSPLYGKIALLIADLLILSVLIFAIVLWIPGLLLVSAFFLFFLGKYSLWNFYGKENLIINTKTISYQHDYGFFKPAYTVVPFNKILNLQVAPAKPIENKELLVKFSSYNDDDLPIEIYTISLSIPEEDVRRLNTLVKQLFADKMADEYMLPHIHLN